MKSIKTLLPVFAICLCASIVKAQKLPSVQTESVSPPPGVKIDGKTGEWNDKFQAYNNHVEFAYTLANDGTNLYLAVQADKRDIIRRIMNGGISLVVNKTGKKADKDGMNVTFPVFESTNRFNPRYTAGSGPTVVRTISGSGGGGASFSGAGGGGGGGGVSFSSGGGGGGLTVVTGGVRIDGAGAASKPLTADEADSLMKANNTNFNNKAKNIALKGFKDLDSLVSVYNEEGIKAAGAFDVKGVFTYEMTIPLKYFGLDAASGTKFTYHMLINAVEQKGVTIVDSAGPGGGDQIRKMTVSAGATMGQDATDFWGEYTLAKK